MAAAGKMASIIVIVRIMVYCLVCPEIEYHATSCESEGSVVSAKARLIPPKI